MCIADLMGEALIGLKQARLREIRAVHGFRKSGGAQFPGPGEESGPGAPGYRPSLLMLS